jgi:serine/threonine-protein kinase HipA
MKCRGCYKDNIEGYCLKCRKRLFDGKAVKAILPFKAPHDENLKLYQEQTKRLSISGVQLKYSLQLNGGELAFTETAGQYILKPVPPSAIAYSEQAPENEHLTMQIAEQVYKINTSPNALIYFEDGTPAYITRRFDVRPDGSKYLQEDFAQLTGRAKPTHGENFKYDGTYEEIGHLIKKYVAASMPAMETFFKTIFFNYLLSNGDAHLKNFSLIQSGAGEYVLTPAYDLMSTIVHVPGETDTALDLFEKDYDTDHFIKYGYHGYPDFIELAKRLSVQEVRANRIITNMISQREKVVEMIRNSFLSDKVKEIYESRFLDKVSRITISH